MAQTVDWNQVGAEAAIAAIVISVAASLNGARSAVIQVDNRTDTPFHLISTANPHGGFAEPPDDVPPHTASVFSVQNVGGSVETGVDGSCSYQAGDVQIDVYWDVPAFGGNSASQDYNGPSAARFQLSDAFAGVGNTGAHMRYQVFNRALADFRSAPYRGNPVLIQGSFNADQGHGNFELVVPFAAGGIGAYYRLNNVPGLPWQQSATFGQGIGPVDGLTMIQSSFGEPGNLEVIANAVGTAQFFFRDSGPSFTWNGPWALVADGQPITGISGAPVLVQSRSGHVGNFELMCALQGGGLAHYWRDNNAPDLPWHGPSTVLSPDIVFDAVTMIQSSYGDGQNLEVIGQSGQQLYFFWRSNSADNFQWHGPYPLTFDGPPVIMGGGNLALIESTFGSQRSNFELLGVVATLFGGQGPLYHAFRNDDVPDKPWAVTTTFGESTPEAAVSMIQSNFGDPGNLEAVIRLESGGLAFAWRVADQAWNGPVVL